MLPGSGFYAYFREAFFFPMHIEAFRAHCLAKPGVTEAFPFDEFTLVFKVMGKVFALVDVQSHPLSFNVKCDPERAEQLREAYPSVQPGYHMNKRHWNTVVADGSVSGKLLAAWVDHSYDLVVAGLPRKLRAQLAAAGEAQG